MVKQINISFDDKDYNILKQKKGDMTWHQFMMLLLEYDNQQTEELHGEQSPDAFNSQLNDTGGYNGK